MKAQHIFYLGGIINMEHLHKSLNQQIANWSVLYTKLHKYHWYVKGPAFFKLHEKFEEFYNEATLMVDEVAERLLTIGGQPLSTLGEYVANASIKEDTNINLTAEQMVTELIADYETLVKESRALIALAEEAEDQETADIFTEKISEIEKDVWMLKAFLG